jgi:hypothetical protein
MWPGSSRRTEQSSLWWVPATLLVFALILAMDPLPFQSPVPAASSLPARFVDTTPVRQPSLQPDYQAGVFSYRCNDCHKIIPARTSDRIRTVLQHQEIQLEHGINTSCLNCHHPTNRNAFANSDGSEIPWDQPQLLCASCHGPVYRDWQHGSHGRSNGHWDASQGKQTRRRCIECHDPHRPPFPAMQPAPGPSTLRMGTQGHKEHSGTHNPLRLSGLRGRSEIPDVSNAGH